MQTWVAEGENRNACESRVVISKESANIYRGQRELISIRDMLLVKNWPMEKVKGIIARGGGIPDPDAPQVPALTQYWVQGSRVQTEEEEVRQRATTEIAAESSAAGIGALMALNTPRASGPAVNVSQEQLELIAKSTGEPGMA